MGGVATMEAGTRIVVYKVASFWHGLMAATVDVGGVGVGGGGGGES